MKRTVVVVADHTFGLVEPFPSRDSVQTQLFEATLKDTLVSCQNLSLGPGWPPPELVLAYPGNREWYAQVAANYWLLVPQMGMTLAQRLDNLLIVLAPGPDDEILFLGARTPHVEARALQYAFVGISQRGACLGPGADGGVYAIGIRGRWPSGVMNEARWHETRAVSDLQRILRRLRIGVAMLDPVEPLVTCEQAGELVANMPECDRDTLPFLRSLFIRSSRSVGDPS